MSRIFISYKRADKEKVFAIKDKIEAATGEKCWIDLDGIESDAQFADVIIHAIDKAEIFLFMYSKKHAQITDYEKDWTIREIGYAEEEHKRIVFVNIDQAPLTKWFKLMFKFKQQVDVTLDEGLNHLLRDLCKWLNISTGQSNTTSQPTPQINNKHIQNTRDGYLVTLISGESNQVGIIKSIKNALGLDLYQVRDIVSYTPSELPHLFSLSEAKQLKTELEMFGAKVAVQAIHVPKLHDGKYYVEIPYANGQDVRKLDEILPYLKTSSPWYYYENYFSREELLKYVKYSPCVLPVLIEADRAAILQGKAQQVGLTLRLVRYSKDTSLVHYKLLSVGETKLQVVKYLSENLKITLGEAKEYIDNTPKVITSAMDFKKSKWVVDDLRHEGAIVSIEFNE